MLQSIGGCLNLSYFSSRSALQQFQNIVNLYLRPGCSSDWLERCVRDAEAAGSSPATPTIYSKGSTRLAKEHGHKDFRQDQSNNNKLQSLALGRPHPVGQQLIEACDNIELT